MLIVLGDWGLEYSMSNIIVSRSITNHHAKKAMHKRHTKWTQEKTHFTLDGFRET